MIPVSFAGRYNIPAGVTNIQTLKQIGADEAHGGTYGAGAHRPHTALDAVNGLRTVLKDPQNEKFASLMGLKDQQNEKSAQFTNILGADTAYALRRGYAFHTKRGTSNNRFVRGLQTTRNYIGVLADNTLFGVVGSLAKKTKDGVKDSLIYDYSRPYLGYKNDRAQGKSVVMASLAAMSYKPRYRRTPDAYKIMSTDLMSKILNPDNAVAAQTAVRAAKRAKFAKNATISIGKAGLAAGTAVVGLKVIAGLDVTTTLVHNAAGQAALQTTASWHPIHIASVAAPNIHWTMNDTAITLGAAGLGLGGAALIGHLSNQRRAQRQAQLQQPYNPGAQQPLAHQNGEKVAEADHRLNEKAGLEPVHYTPLDHGLPDHVEYAPIESFGGSKSKASLGQEKHEELKPASKYQGHSNYNAAAAPTMMDIFHGKPVY